MKLEILEKDKVYHIYNKGINGETIFNTDENKRYFLKLYLKYLERKVETFAYCLMDNHFHFVFQINNEKEVTQALSNLFNAYAKAFNKQNNRTGSLFETTFERKLVSSEKYFQQLIFYIHNNPVHHGFVKQMGLYPWSSFETVISDKPTKLKRKEVIELYGDIENFILYHNQQQNFNEINDLIIEY